MKKSTIMSESDNNGRAFVSNERAATLAQACGITGLDYEHWDRGLIVARVRAHPTRVVAVFSTSRCVDDNNPNRACFECSLDFFGVGDFPPGSALGLICVSPHERDVTAEFVNVLEHRISQKRHGVDDNHF